MERIAAIVAKLVDIFALIGSGMGKSLDLLEIRKIQGRSHHNAQLVQGSPEIAQDLGMIDADIRCCIEILQHIDGYRHPGGMDGFAFLPYVEDLGRCFPGFTLEDHANRLDARLADAKKNLENLEKGKITPPRIDEPGSRLSQAGATRTGKALTLLDFIEDHGEVATRVAMARIGRAREEVDAVRRKLDAAATTYPSTFLSQLPLLLSQVTSSVDATSVRQRFDVMLVVATSVMDNVLAIDIPDEMLYDMAAIVGDEPEPFVVSITESGELEAVQASIRDLKSRLDSIEQDLTDTAIDAEDRRALIAKRGRLEANLFDFQHRKMDLDVRVSRKETEQRALQRATYLKKIIGNALGTTT